MEKWMNDKLVITTAQAPAARRTIAWLRAPGDALPALFEDMRSLPGYEAYKASKRGDCYAAWAAQLEAALQAMKLTLTREQIPLAREMVGCLRNGHCAWPEDYALTPGHAEYLDDMEPDARARWADALEAAITEAEGKDADPRQPGPVSDADEREFWRTAYLIGRANATVGTTGAFIAGSAAAEADEALARYRAAFGGTK